MCPKGIYVLYIHTFIRVYYVAGVYDSEMIEPGLYSTILGLQLDCHTFHSFALCSTGCCVRVCWFCPLSVCAWSGLCCDQWVFSVQGAAQGQNALLPETRGDRKPGPEGARRRGLQVSSTLTYSDVTLHTRPALCFIIVCIFLQLLTA